MKGIVITYKQVEELTLALIPLWRNWFDSFEFVVPEDAVPDNLPGTVYPVGLSCVVGEGTVARMRMACKLAASYSVATVLEYDTVLFGTPPGVAVNTLMGARYIDEPNSIYKSKWFMHSPWLATKSAWQSMSEIPGELEPCVPDRWLAAAADACGIIPVNISGSYSQDIRFQDEHIRQAVESVKSGSTVVHGVKTLHILQLLMSARERFENNE